MNGRVEPVLIGAHRAPNEAPDAVGRGRLEAERPAALLQLSCEVALVAGVGDGVVAQPGTELFGVGDRRLAKAEQGTDLGPLALERAVGGARQQRCRAIRHR